MQDSEKVNIFQSLFRGRRNAFLENQRCQKKPLTDAVIRAHILGQRRIGVYLLDPEEGNGTEVSFSAEDIDSDINGLEKALAIKQAYQELGITSYIEASKSENSFHIWHFFNHSISAKDIRRISGYVLKKIGLEGVEANPKQNKLTSRMEYGNAIHLPLHGEYAKANRTVFVDDDGKPLADQWEYLSNVWYHSRAEIGSVIDELPEPEIKRGRKPTNESKPISPKNIGAIPENFVTLTKCDALVRSLWRNTREERSDLDWALGRACIERGITKREELESILGHYPHGKYRRDGRLDYLALTVQKLMDTIPNKPVKTAPNVYTEIKTAIKMALNSLEKSSVIVIGASPGAGKTRAAREAIEEWNKPVIIGMQTGDRADEEYRRFSKPVTLLKGRNRENCFNFGQVEAVSSRGYSPGRTVCPRCPYGPVYNDEESRCGYYRQFTDTERIKVCSYEQAIELHEASKLDADLIVFDEDPTRAIFRPQTLFETHFQIDSSHPKIIQQFGEMLQNALEIAQEESASKEKADNEKFLYPVHRGKALVGLLERATARLKEGTQEVLFGKAFDKDFDSLDDLPIVREAIEKVFDTVGGLHNIDHLQVLKLPHRALSTLAMAIEKDYQKAREANDFNSPLVLVVTEDSAFFVLRQIRELKRATPILILDAYARKHYYEKLLNRKVDFVNATAKCNFTTWQVPLNTSKRAFSRKGSILMQTLRNLLKRFEGYSVVIYTHKKQKALVQQIAKGIGIEVAIDHFWSGRGTNDYENYQVIIIFGTPEANTNSLLDDARALYANDSDLVSNEQVNRWTFKDERLQELREMKRKDEILQIAHRIRPIHAKLKDEKHVVIVSQLYLEQLPPDHILEPKSLGGMERKDALEAIIRLTVDSIGFWTDLVLTSLSNSQNHKLGCSDNGENLDTVNKTQAMTGYLAVLIRESINKNPSVTSIDAGLIDCARYLMPSSEFYRDRDLTLSKLGLDSSRISVQIDGVWKPFKVWGDAEKARSLLSPPKNSTLYETVVSVEESEVDKLLEFCVRGKWQVKDALGRGVALEVCEKWAKLWNESDNPSDWTTARDELFKARWG